MKIFARIGYLIPNLWRKPLCSREAKALPDCEVCGTACAHWAPRSSFCCKNMAMASRAARDTSKSIVGIYTTRRAGVSSKKYLSIFPALGDVCVCPPRCLADGYAHFRGYGEREQRPWKNEVSRCFSSSNTRVAGPRASGPRRTCPARRGTAASRIDASEKRRARGLRSKEKKRVPTGVRCRAQALRSAPRSSPNFAGFASSSARDVCKNARKTGAENVYFLGT